MGAGELNDPERRLALSYAPASRRAALAALWRLDETLGEVVRGGGGAMVRQIKLVWWRDALAALDGAPPPAEPLLQALASEVAARGVTGTVLAELEDPWSVLLEEGTLGSEELAGYALRGRLLFRSGLVLLGGTSDDAIERAGEAWALADLARRTSREAEARAALALAAVRMPGGFVWPRALRPLGVLAALAARDASARVVPPEPQGSPARLLRMLRMRFTGR